MTDVELDPALFSQSIGKTVLVTGAARGIGAAIAILFNSHGANVVLADLSQFQQLSKDVIHNQMQSADRAIFVSADITNWAELTACFESAITKFGNLDIVVANAGMMESQPVLDIDTVDANGRLLENIEAARVIDVNLKGTLNSELSLQMQLLNSVPRLYVELLRWDGSSGNVARAHGVRVNAVAPFLTPTHITAGFARQWDEAGLEKNSPEAVARAVALVALDGGRQGNCVLVAGKYLRELEEVREKLLPRWLGKDLAEFMRQAMRFFVSIGGYVLPRKY
ncbi:Short-chain dehydrogenase/reductase SDR [Penicillium sp. IBT 31633x]|nr:Short-chain dehydrogenase/reductase SDR [Penicillium sp. IBT 31633x]